MTELPPPVDTGPAQPAPAKTTTGASRATRVVLALSLAANLAVGGFVLGHALDGGGPGGHRDRPGDMSFGPFSDALDDTDRRSLRDALFARAPDMREAHKKMGQDLAGLVTALRAEPFDPAALDAALTAQNRRMSDNLAVAQGVLRDFLIAMTPQARADFAARLSRRIGGGGD